MSASLRINRSNTAVRACRTAVFNRWSDSLSDRSTCRRVGQPVRSVPGTVAQDSRDRRTNLSDQCSRSVGQCPSDTGRHAVRHRSSSRVRPVNAGSAYKRDECSTKCTCAN
ncbi:hypothetical protein PCASD_06850 [Puccinia coronata f. sp. avenae]|uniref:Uncharacterized protein n=1 Tax=Puccinia coronata f. sp. avenae TaxID=200324 RepID=A0A2N5UQM6_9BASI|nr:hypothetical protein PCASD_06850 [Puccinia coronata f. sp. avenae]